MQVGNLGPGYYLAKFKLIYDQIVQTVFKALAVYSKPAGGISLGIAIHQQYLKSFHSYIRSQIYRGGGLTNPSFLVCNRNHLCHSLTPFIL
ncbi:hypothetical protein SDC9_203771 [bioreactor metagenome]|uniref:Uncharacterized protein n=1 Tax=bioreactor metagenome TaxID=1076179 RepID=A0A645IXC8_9ZZZZ